MKILTNYQRQKYKELKIYLTAGIITGVVNGLFGGGGGMIVIPFLTNVLHYEQKTAHATAIAIILPITIASALVYLAGGTFKMQMLPAGAGIILGGIIGSVALKRISEKTVFYTFFAFMILGGLKMLFW